MGNTSKAEESHLVTLWVEIYVHFLGIEISTINPGDQVDPTSILLDIICLSAQERFGINNFYILDKEESSLWWRE